MKNFAILAIFALVFTCTTFADLKVIDNTADFEKIIQESEVPVIVKFSAYWWVACENLKNTLVKVAANYSDDQVLICTVDAYVNSDLKKYLLGGYPSVRVFSKGKTNDASFVGNKDEAFVTGFINDIISSSSSSISPDFTRGEFKELNSVAEFENLIENSTVPVIVKFSAHWWSSCTKLKNTMVKVATSYSDKQVLLCTIDASVHTELKKYLLGGYPTVRVFAKGKVGDKSFLGNKPESFVRNFVDETIANSLENNNVQTSPQKRSNLIEIENTQQFENIISSSQVPVIVKFSAYWWSTCTNLKNTLTTVSASYSSDQVLICTVDAFVNSELKKYLLGGYPTVRVFSKGKAGDKSFVGSKSEFFVRNFIDEVIQK